MGIPKSLRMQKGLVGNPIETTPKKMMKKKTGCFRVPGFDPIAASDSW